MQADDPYEAQLNHDEAVAVSEAYYTALITEVLTKTACIVPIQALGLPYVSYQTGAARIDHASLSEIVADECSTGKPLEALMAVIASSSCPFVAELRKTIASSYAHRNAADLAEVSQ